MVDSKGLVTTTRGDELPAHKKIYARTDGTPDMKDLTQIVKYAKPHGVVGLTGGGEAWGKVTDSPPADPHPLPSPPTLCLAHLIGKPTPRQTHASVPSCLTFLATC